MCNKQMKSELFSEIMDKKMAAIKPPTSGKTPRVLPELTVLTGNKSGFPKPQTNNPAIAGNGNNEELLTPNSSDSYKNMNPTLGFDPSSSTWAEEVDKASKMGDASLLDSSVEEAPDKKDGKGKGKKGKRGGEGSKKEPPKKKAKPGLTWADVAKHRICLITSNDLDRMLVHEDWVHIGKQVLKNVRKLPRSEYAKTRVVKSGVREGIIQFTLDSEEGIRWFEEIVPSFPPKNDGEPGYRFFKPGQRPFQTFKVVVSEPEAADDLAEFVEDLRAYNTFLTEGYMSASKISTTKTLAVIRLRVGEELVEALAKEDFQVCYGFGSITLRPLAAGGAGGNGVLLILLENVVTSSEIL